MNVLYGQLSMHDIDVEMEQAMELSIDKHVHHKLNLMMNLQILIIFK
jgi:hypothetical protein